MRRPWVFELIWIRHHEHVPPCAGYLDGRDCGCPVVLFHTENFGDCPHCDSVIWMRGELDAAFGEAVTLLANARSVVYIHDAG